MRFLVVLCLVALCGCAGTNKQILSAKDFKFCDNGKISYFSRANNEFFNSVVYSCGDPYPLDPKSKVSIVTTLPPDAKLIGGQIITVEKENAPYDKMTEVRADHTKFIGANVLLEDMSYYVASPETHHYKAYYSEMSK